MVCYSSAKLPAVKRNVGRTLYRNNVLIRGSIQLLPSILQIEKVYQLRFIVRLVYNRLVYRINMCYLCMFSYV